MHLLCVVVSLVSSVSKCLGLEGLEHYRQIRFLHVCILRVSRTPDLLAKSMGEAVHHHSNIELVFCCLCVDWFLVLRRW